MIKTGFLSRKSIFIEFRSRLYFYRQAVCFLLLSFIGTNLSLFCFDYNRLSTIKFTEYKFIFNVNSDFFFSTRLGAPCTALREVSLLKGLKHNNIVSLHDIIFNQTTLTLVFEYVEKDLKQYMDDCGNILHIKNVRLFLFQLLRGLDYCHVKKILHRDLK